MLPSGVKERIRHLLGEGLSKISRFLPPGLFIALLWLWRISEDFLERSYGYHAAALSFSFFLTLNSAVVFLGTILKYIPEKEVLLNKIYQLFPNLSKGVLDAIILSVENLSVQVQLLTLLLVLYFLGNFLRTLELAFAYIAAAKPRPLPIINYLLPLVFGLLMLLYGSLDIVIAVALKLLEHIRFVYPVAVKFFLTLKGVLDYLAFPLGLFIIYWSLSPVRVKKRLALLVAFTVGFLLNPLKELFSWYATHFLLKNLILTPLAGILIFLLWVYAVFYFLLIGYRLLLALQVFLYGPPPEGD